MDPAAEGDVWRLEAYQRAEIVVCRVRCFMALAVPAMVIVFDAASGTAALAVTAGLLVAAGHTRRRAREAGSLGAARLVARRAVLVDIVGALAIFALFLADPQATPIVLFPLVVFVLTAYFGVPGTAAGLALFLAGLGVRMYAQSHVLDGGAIRPPLVLAWTMVALVMVAFARELRAEQAARVAAMQERERIAGRFRATMRAVLERAGIAAGAATRDDVLQVVERMCHEKADETKVLAATIADLIVPPPAGFGLTRREREILTQLGMGNPYDRVAATLFVSPSTVRNHAHNIRHKLGLGSHRELVEFAREHGFAGSGDDPAPGRTPEQPKVAAPTSVDA